MEELNPKVQPYNNSSFKYWCHDTPGFINPEQVSAFLLIINCQKMYICHTDSSRCVCVCVYSVYYFCVILYVCGEYANVLKKCGF